jgi:hypothetical protein
MKEKLQAKKGYVTYLNKHHHPKLLNSASAICQQWSHVVIRKRAWLNT